MKSEKTLLVASEVEGQHLPLWLLLSSPAPVECAGAAGAAGARRPHSTRRDGHRMDRVSHGPQAASVSSAHGRGKTNRSIIRAFS